MGGECRIRVMVRAIFKWSLEYRGRYPPHGRSLPVHVFVDECHMPDKPWDLTLRMNVICQTSHGI